VEYYKLEIGRGPWVESEGPSVGKGGENDVESQDLQGCSICLYRLRTDGLTPRE
jgi:hypothetical protein